MAWTKVKLQGHLSPSGRDSKARTATLTYVAVSDTPTTAVAAETASDGVTTIPTIGSSPIAADTARKVRTVNATPDADSPRLVFTVTVECSTQSSGTIAGNPLDEPDRVTWEFSDGTEPYFMDRTTPTPKAVATSAGEPFDPMRERETGAIRAVIKRYIGSNAYSPITAVNYKDAVNNDSITVDGIIISPNQAKMKSYTASDKQEINGVACREAQFILDLKETWDDIVEDRGYHELTVAGIYREIVKGEGTTPKKPDKPWPLVDGVAQSTPASAPGQLTFVPYFKKAFAGFSFD